MQVQTPDGRLVSVQIPKDACSGQMLTIALEKADPKEEKSTKQPMNEPEKNSKAVWTRQTPLYSLADMKMSPFKAVGVMVQKFMEARFHQRALHHEEVIRIHDDRESNSVHLAKKQEEISKRGEENKRKLAARLQERSSK